MESRHEKMQVTDDVSVCLGSRHISVPSESWVPSSVWRACAFGFNIWLLRSSNVVQRRSVSTTGVAGKQQRSRRLVAGVVIKELALWGERT